MSNFNKRLVELQPYVLSIRFNKGLTVIDTSFQSNWSVMKSDSIGYEQLPDKPDYYMLFGLHDDVGIDEILDFVEEVIRLNKEREEKFSLLHTKTKELESIFKSTSLDRCKTLQFTFNDGINESTDISISDIPLTASRPIAPTGSVEIPFKETPIAPPYIPEEPKTQNVDRLISEQQKVKDVRDERDIPGVTEVEREVNADVEAWNKQVQAEAPTARVGGETFDLPPRQSNKHSVELETFDVPDVVCNCDPNNPNDVCPACIDF